MTSMSTLQCSHPSLTMFRLLIGAWPIQSLPITGIVTRPNQQGWKPDTAITYQHWNNLQVLNVILALRVLQNMKWESYIAERYASSGAQWYESAFKSLWWDFPVSTNHVPCTAFCQESEWILATSIGMTVVESKPVTPDLPPNDSVLSTRDLLDVMLHCVQWGHSFKQPSIKWMSIIEK